MSKQSIAHRQTGRTGRGAVWSLECWVLCLLSSVSLKSAAPVSLARPYIEQKFLVPLNKPLQVVCKLLVYGMISTSSYPKLPIPFVLLDQNTHCPLAPRFLVPQKEN